jgi:hypothetical protein
MALLRTKPGFQGKNVEAQEFAQGLGAALVREISEETREAIRTAIARVIREGIPPYEAAKLIKTMIGLTSQQVQGVMNYRAQMINAGHPAAKVDQLVGKYTDKKLAQRSKTIARTETMRALNEGKVAAAIQMVNEDLLGEDAIKEWLTTPDELLCPICEAMDGVQVPFIEDFETEGPPAHPNCRCTVVILPGSEKKEEAEKEAAEATDLPEVEIPPGPPEIDTGNADEGFVDPEFDQDAPAPNLDEFDDDGEEEPTSTLDDLEIGADFDATDIANLSQAQINELIATGVLEPMEDPNGQAPAPFIYDPNEKFDGYRSTDFMRLESYGLDHSDLESINPQNIRPSERSAFSHYQGSGYRALNKSLREEEEPRDLNLLAGLDSVFARASGVDEPLLVYRGGSINLSDLTPGNEYIDRGFGSTSTNPSGAFPASSSGNRVGAKWTIELPPGARAVHMESLSGDDIGEEEILLNRGTTFRILSVDKVTDRWGEDHYEIRARIIPRR